MTGHTVRTVLHRRTRAVAAAGVIISLFLVVPATMSAAADTNGGGVVKVQRTSGPLGALMVSAKGRTLYVDVHDRPGHVTCTAGCARLWPPLLLARGTTKAVAGAGVTGLGTIRRPGHRLQITWHRAPLYLYAGDVLPGQAKGQGVGATFFVVTPKGVLRSVPTSPTMSSASSTSTTEVPAVTPVAPAVTTPPATSPPATSPPATSPPVTSPPVTSPPVTAAPVGGGVAY